MSGKIALITGAGTGIGRSVAMALAEKGYRLVLAGRKADTLEMTAGMTGRSKDDVICVPTDVTDRASVDSLFREVKAHFGRLDLLFNNAGIAVGGPLEDLAADDWLAVINTNLNGAFWCLQGAFRMMKEQDPQGGRIINNGSISADRPRPGSIAYTASKHGVTGLTKTASLDGRKYSIACGQIDIGNAATEMGARVSHATPQADGSLKDEPVMDVKHVGDAVVYMDSLPLDANVLFMTVMATNMPYIGRG